MPPEAEFASGRCCIICSLFFKRKAYGAMEYLDMLEALNDILEDKEGTLKFNVPITTRRRIERQVNAIKQIRIYYELMEERLGDFYKKFNDRKEQNEKNIAFLNQPGKYSSIIHDYEGKLEEDKEVLNDLASLQNETNFLQ